MAQRTLCGFALLIFVLGLASGLARALALAGSTVAVETIARQSTRHRDRNHAAARRAGYTRPSDQIIVFVDEADYAATDAAGQKQVKHRQAGEIVWHNKGEAAPLLVNQGKQAYRNLVIALK